MLQRLKKPIVYLSSGVTLFFAFAPNTKAQPAPQTPSVPSAMETQTKSSIGGGMVNFEAKLVDPATKAAKQTATVQVTISGINLVDPDEVGPKPQPGQGHLHYQLDNGPIIATTATKLSFHNLSPGDHKIVVTIAGNDHKPISRDNTLSIKIP